ncbi:ATPase, F1/V1/A1 complex, alpha/beta subunit, partial [Tanacetum coccineum]
MTDSDLHRNGDDNNGNEMCKKGEKGESIYGNNEEFMGNLNGDSFPVFNVGDLNGDSFPVFNNQVNNSYSNQMHANSDNESINVDVDNMKACVDENGDANNNVNMSKNDDVESMNKAEQVGDETIKENRSKSINGMLNSNDSSVRSFVDIANNAKLNNSLLSIPIVINEKGNEVVVFNDDLIERRIMWNTFGLGDMYLKDKGIFFFKFHDEIRMNEVINSGPWMVNNKSLFVQKLSIDVCLDRAEPKKLPIALASSLGKPIIMDDMTTKMYMTGEGRLGYARVLVEISVDKVVKDNIEIVYKRK